MEIGLYTPEHTGTASVIGVSETVFAKKFNEPLIHQVITAYLARGRAGTRAQKNRARVSGGGSKPWRQKGTGRARAGTIRSPLWRGGGVTFAAQPVDYNQKINKKMYRGAVCSILSELLRRERLKVIDQFTVSSHKTRDLMTQLRTLNLVPSEKNSILIVTEEVETTLNLASRNLAHISVCSAKSVDPLSLMKAEQVLMTVTALKSIETRLQKTPSDHSFRENES